MVDRRIRFIYLAAIVMVALFVSQVATAQQTVRLELKQKPGDVNQYGIKMSGKSKVTSEGSICWVASWDL